MEASGRSLTKGGREVSPEVVGLSSNPLTTSCVRHCAKGEGGAKRERRLRRTEGGWQKYKGTGVSRGPMPYRCQLQPPPTWNLGSLLQPALPRCLVPICQPGSSELQAQGGTARPPPSCQAAACIPLPAYGGPSAEVLDSGSITGQLAGSPGPTALALARCLGQSGRRWVAGGFSRHTRKSCRSSVPRRTGRGSSLGISCVCLASSWP